jgi:ribonuclease BN (tRNA processing enzyme)
MLPELGLVLDAGTGFFRVREHLVTPTLEIMLSHAHLDHVIGLTYLFDVLHKKNVERVTVRGAPRKLEVIAEQMLSPHLFPATLPIQWAPLIGPVTLADGSRLTYFPLEHPGGSLGFRIDWPDRAFAFVTDTTAKPGAAYAAHLEGVDVLIHECNFPDGWEALAEQTGHSCTTPVAELAKAVGVKRLILSHVFPISNEFDPLNLSVARRIFPNTDIAIDGLELDV